MTDSVPDEAAHRKMCYERRRDTERVADAYREAEDALAKAGKLLRTTTISGYFGWVNAPPHFAAKSRNDFDDHEKQTQAENLAVK